MAPTDTVKETEIRRVAEQIDIFISEKTRKKIICNANLMGKWNLCVGKMMFFVFGVKVCYKNAIFISIIVLKKT